MLTEDVGAARLDSVFACHHRPFANQHPVPATFAKKQNKKKLKERSRDFLVPDSVKPNSPKITLCGYRSPRRKTRVDFP